MSRSWSGPRGASDARWSETGAVAGPDNHNPEDYRRYIWAARPPGPLARRGGICSTRPVVEAQPPLLDRSRKCAARGPSTAPLVPGRFASVHLPMRRMKKPPRRLILVDYAGGV